MLSGLRGPGLHIPGGGKVDFKQLAGDNIVTPEIMREVEIGNKGALGGGSDNPVFEFVAGGKAQNADGFYADVAIGGGVGDTGVGLVGDGTGEDVRGAAAGVGDVDEGDFDLLVGAIEIEIEVRELADAEFAVDSNAGMDFLAGIAVGFEADARFQELDLGGGLGGSGLFGGFCGRRWVLGAVGRRYEKQCE